MSELRGQIRSAWQGRISGCQLGKPVELLSVTQGADAVTAYLAGAGALPLRDYVPQVADTIVFGLAHILFEASVLPWVQTFRLGRS